MKEKADYTKINKRVKEKKAPDPGRGAHAIQAEEKIQYVPIQLIKLPLLVHRDQIDDEDMRELERSIRQYGLQDPIKLRRKEKKYELIYGHRRYQAHVNLGKVAIKANVIECGDEIAEALKWDENRLHKHINPVESARAMRETKDLLRMSNRQVADITGYSEQKVGQYLKMLKWPECLLNAVRKDQISFSAGRELAKITNEKDLEAYVTNALMSGCTPRLAMQWRSEWEVDQSRNYPRSGAGQTEESTFQQHIITTPCFLCEEHGEMNKMQMIWVHPDCRHSFVTAIERERVKIAAAEDQSTPGQAHE